MTLFTEQVVRRVEAAGPAEFYNWSPRDTPRGLRFRFERARRIIGSLATLVRHGRTSDGQLYIAANSEGGLLLTALAVAVGCSLGYTVYLHHHVYYYIDRHDWRMGLINRLVGANGVHVVHCEQMERDFRATYPSQSSFIYLNPSVVSLPVRNPRLVPHSPFRIGHLGNLSTAKGLDLVLKTFEELIKNGRSVLLKLAGPYHTSEARNLVEKALAAHPGSLESAGPLYGEQKAEFFDGIDCFLFPSRSESWGIVLNEAMAAGVPVITQDRGCARTAVGSDAGIIVDQESQYVQTAVNQISLWMDNPATYATVSRAACRQAAHLSQVADQQLDDFVRQLWNRG
jgi:glycosyltransferase involved in cell wall biosynthesis